MGLQAQEKFGFGIHGGLNYPDVRGFDLAKYNNFKLGFLVGASAEYRLGEQWGLRSDINFERKVNVIRITYYDSNAIRSGAEEFRKHYNYINLPVMVSYKVGRYKAPMLYL